MAQNGSSLAAHFHSKRRLFGAADAVPDARVNQATDKLKNAKQEAENVVFRFDFSVSRNGVVPSTGEDAKKKKNKKKNKKNKKKNVVPTEPPTTEAASAAAPVSSAPVASQQVDPDVTKAIPKKPSNNRPKTPPPDKQADRNQKAKSNKKPPPQKTTVAPVSKAVVAPPPGFLTLRKPTSSDSEVMKMQLRYGHGKRNLAATAQRQKLKQQAADKPPAGEAAATANSSSTFQFNFFGAN